MRTKILMICTLLVWSLSAGAQNSKQERAILEKASEAMGANNLNSVQYSGSGFNFALGQSPNPGAPWPKFNVKSYSRLINFYTASSREELLRTQFEDPPRGGGAQPIIGEQRQILFVGGSGTYAWNQTGDTATPIPAAAEERALQ